MSELTALQRFMLRGWAINTTVATRFSRKRWFGFDYTMEEEARLKTIAGDIAGGAMLVWGAVSLILYLLIEIPIFSLAFIDFQFLPFPVIFVIMIATVFTALPVAMGIAAWIVDRLFRLPEFAQGNGDAELVAKVRGQFLIVAAVATVIALVIYFFKMG